MILENFTPSGNFSSFDDLVGSDQFSGEPGELSELTESALSEMYNLSMAVGRIEYKCLAESTVDNTALMESAVGDYFKRAGETIKKWWNQFIAWLGSLWTRLKDVFVKRADWLSRNKGDAAKATDAQLKGMTAKVGSEVLDTAYSRVVAASIAEAKAIVASADGVTPSTASGFKEKAKEMIGKALAKRSAKASISERVHDSLVGESKDVELTSAIIARMIKTAEETFTAIDQMKGAKMIAETAVKYAEGIVRSNGTDKDAVNAKVSALRDVASLVQASVAAHASALSTANGQVMPAIVKAANAGKKAAPAAAASTNEAASVLSQYM